MRNPTRSRIDRKSFVWGFASAALIFLIMLSGVTAFASSRGVTVQLDSEDMATLVRDSIVAQARAEMPNIITNAKAEIPIIVEQEMESQFKSDRMEIAGFVFQMPEELTAQLKKNMRQNVESATGKILDGIETEKLAEKFGENAYAMVLSTMESEISGQSFQVLLFDIIPLKVRIQVK